MTTATATALALIIRQYNQGIITTKEELYHRITALYMQQPQHH